MNDLEPYREALASLPPVLHKNFGKSMEELTVRSLQNEILLPRDLLDWFNDTVIPKIENAAKSGNFETSVRIGRDPVLVEHQIRVWCEQRGLRCNVTNSWIVDFYWGPVKHYYWPVTSIFFHAISLVACCIFASYSGTIAAFIFCTIMAINAIMGLVRSIRDI